MQRHWADETDSPLQFSASKLPCWNCTAIPCSFAEFRMHVPKPTAAHSDSESKSGDMPVSDLKSKHQVLDINAKKQYINILVRNSRVRVAMLNL